MSCLTQTYFNYIVVVSFTGGGNRSTRKKHRHSTSHWQTLSHNVVSILLVVKNNHQPFTRHWQTLSHNVVSILLVDGYGCGDYRHFEQYFRHVLAISFIGGGNRSTRGHWQPLSHSGVSVILVEHELIIYLISSPVVSWVHVARSWVFFELRLLITSLESSTFSVSLSLQFSVCCFMDHWFLFCIL